MQPNEQDLEAELPEDPEDPEDLEFEDFLARNGKPDLGALNFEQLHAYMTELDRQKEEAERQRILAEEQ